MVNAVGMRLRSNRDLLVAVTHGLPSRGREYFHFSTLGPRAVVIPPRLDTQPHGDGLQSYVADGVRRYCGVVFFADASAICLVAPSPDGICGGGKLRDEFLMVMYVGELGVEVAHSATWRDEAI